MNYLFYPFYQVNHYSAICLMKTSSLSFMVNSQITDPKRTIITSKHNSVLNNYNSKILKCIIQHSSYPTTNYRPNQNIQTTTNQILPSKTIKLINFTPNHQSSQLQSNNFISQKKSSFLLTNRLTRSAFDFKDSAMIGNHQSLKTFRSTTNYGSQNDFLQLKTAVKLINKKSTRNPKQRQSAIPQVYRKAFSLSNISPTKKQLNASLDKSFFPTTTVQQKTKTQIIDEQSLKIVKEQKFKLLPFTQIIRPKLLQKQRIQKRLIAGLSKPQSERKLRNIDNKLSQLRRHNQSLYKLMPIPINKPQVAVIKGRGQLISLQKIIRMADKLLNVLELYFQMHQQNSQRVMDFVNNIEGFQNPKIKQIFCTQHGIRHMSSNEQILQYFWVFKSLRTKKSGVKIELPQFWGEQDLALYKVLNNLSLKLQSKYENSHRESYRKMKEMKMQKQESQFHHLLKQSTTHRSIHSNSSQVKTTKISVNPIRLNDSARPNSDLLEEHKQHIDRKSLLSQIKYHPVVNDKKMAGHFEELQDLGVKFNFRQKGKNIILAERSKILYSKR